MKIYHLACLFLVALTLGTSLQAQQRRFTGAIVAGITASQIDGDQSAGYNKPGLMAGARGGILWTDRMETTIELLYSQRGAQNELFLDNVVNFSLTLHYIEVPVLFHYKDWQATDGRGEDFYRVSFDGGLSYARLMDVGVRDDLSFIEAVAPDFLEDNDLSIVLGATFYTSSHFGIQFRWVRSLIPVYQPSKWDMPPASETWRPHSLYLSGMYIF